jgi:hypothetical protein
MTCYQFDAAIGVDDVRPRTSREPVPERTLKRVQAHPWFATEDRCSRTRRDAMCFGKVRVTRSEEDDISSSERARLRLAPAIVVILTAIAIASTVTSLMGLS